MARLTKVPATYREADELLGERKTLRLGHNTTLVRRVPDIAMRLHETDIVTWTPDGHLILDTRGWWTVTTKNRINQVPGIRVWSDRREAFVRWQTIAHRFEDGMALDPDGGVTYR